MRFLLFVLFFLYYDFASAYSVALIGTSLTAKGAWVNDFKSKLQSCYSPHAIDFYLIAKPGVTSEWARESIYGLPPDGVDLAFVEFSVNDSSLLRLVPSYRSLENHKFILDYLRGLNPKVVVIYHVLAPVRGARGIIRPGFDGLNKMLSEFASRERVFFFDQRYLWRRFTTNDLDLLIPDGLHPDGARAASFISDNLFNYSKSVFGVLSC